jgi:HYR domain
MLRLARIALTLVLVAAAGALPAAGSASAAVPDAPWFGSGGGETVVSDGTVAQPRLDYALARNSGTWTFGAVSKSARIQPVGWSYLGYHGTDNAYVKLERYVIRDGTEIVTQPLAAAGPVSCCGPPSGGFEYTGETTFTLQPGDVYGFRMSGSESDRAPRITGSLRLTVPDATPPSIRPAVTGRLGAGGYYTSDIDVGWTVVDDESPVEQVTGCDDVRVTADTSGTTYTCAALSDGGAASESVTIRRDTAAPALTVPGTIRRDGAGPDGAAVEYAAAAADAIDPSPSVRCSPESGGRFPIGATKVTCSAADAAGNTVAKGFDVLVFRGADPPTASPELDASLAFRSSVRNRFTRISRLTVRDVPAGSAVKLTCKGPSCPMRLKGKAVTRRAARTSLDVSRLVQGRLKAGTVITVAVSAPDGRSATMKLRIRKGRAPTVT